MKYRHMDIFGHYIPESEEKLQVIRFWTIFGLLVWQHFPVFLTSKVCGVLLSKSLLRFLPQFYPTAHKGCQGIVFTHGVRTGGGKKFVWPVSRKP